MPSQGISKKRMLRNGVVITARNAAGLSGKTLLSPDGELICQSCSEDFRVDEDDSPDYECSICGDTESEDRFFFEGEYFCQKHFKELFVDAEPDN
jgi:hypothetical protein